MIWKKDILNVYIYIILFLFYLNKIDCYYKVKNIYFLLEIWIWYEIVIKYCLMYFGGGGGYYVVRFLFCFNVGLDILKD